MQPAVTQMVTFMFLSIMVKLLRVYIAMPRLKLVCINFGCRFKTAEISCLRAAPIFGPVDTLSH